MCKAGFAGDDAPRAVFPSIVGRPRHKGSSGINAEYGGLFGGKKKVNPNDALQLQLLRGSGNQTDTNSSTIQMSSQIGSYQRKETGGGGGATKALYHRGPQPNEMKSNVTTSATTIAPTSMTLSSPVAVPPGGMMSAVTPISVGMVPVGVPPTFQSSPATTGGELEKVVALYDYTADEEGELTFKEGDIILILSKDPSGWWRGRTEGGEGDFPSNYVGAVGSTNPNDGADDNDDVVTTIEANYVALYDYVAEEEGELTILKDQLLYVFTERGGWFFGRNHVGETGLFPSNYVASVS
eukprot:TRINITY_DN6510_c0_g1_i23.p1 TRINITY_DN6510_c0_g1~~TRINITY_DN6510_c0_g1_i23.p1  ORF type:complete len:316 (-),score=94.21 TRINITY_DN6510_c0_g1_i23:301-1188(-)